MVERRKGDGEREREKDEEKGEGKYSERQRGVDSARAACCRSKGAKAKKKLRRKVFNFARTGANECA